MKFAKKLYAVIESGMPGTSTPIKNLSEEPIQPKKLKSLLLYLLFIKRIIHSPRQGAIKYASEDTTIETQISFAGGNLEISESILDLIWEIIKFFNSKTWNDATAQELHIRIKKEQKTFIMNDFLEVKDNLKAYIIVKPLKESENVAEFKRQVYPIPVSDYQSFITLVTHDLLHYIINPQTVAKFNVSKFGDFSFPVGYTPEEYLQEVPALITDLFMYEVKDMVKNKGVNLGKLVNLRRPNSNGQRSYELFPLFFNILRHLAVQKAINNLSIEDAKKVLGNPVAALTKISPEPIKIYWNEIENAFKNYPNFIKTLNTTKKIVLHKIEDIMILLKKEYSLSKEYNRLISEVKNNSSLENSLDEISKELEEIKTKRQKLNSEFLRFSELNNQSKRKGYKVDLVNLKRNLKGASYFYWSKNTIDATYEFFDKILYGTLQSSSSFMQKKDESGKLESLGASENKINDFLNFVGNATKKYNSSVS